ncbi:MAG: PDZ domain-containing protein [Clostridia bacterium]|nr:PDZ domain-containing protein [Clostridia bacterium]
MRKRITKAVAYAFGVCILAALLGIGLLDYHIPKSITVENGESLPSYPCVSLTTPVSESFRSDYSESVTCAKLFGVIPLKEITVKKFDGVTLIPGGMTFGMQLLTDGVLTVGFSDIRTGGKIVCPAREAGILPKDVIIKIDGKPLSTVGELTRRMEEAKGKTLSVTVRRDGGEKTF